MLIGEVARRSGVSARMLRHYEALGLLRPSGRTGSGYREYSLADIQRIFHVESLRAVGLSLREIGRTLDDPGFTPSALVDDLIRQTRERVAAERPSCSRGCTGSTPRTRPAGRTSSRLSRSCGLWGPPAPTHASARPSHRPTRFRWRPWPRRHALAHPDAVVRGHAALALGTPGEADAVPTLVDMIVVGRNDTDAADALSVLAGDDAAADRITAVLVGRLAHDTIHASTRGRLPQALAGVPGTAASRALGDLLHDADRAVALTAAYVLQLRDVE